MRIRPRLAHTRERTLRGAQTPCARQRIPPLDGDRDALPQEGRLTAVSGDRRSAPPELGDEVSSMLAPRTQSLEGEGDVVNARGMLSMRGGCCRMVGVFRRLQRLRRGSRGTSDCRRRLNVRRCEGVGDLDIPRTSPGPMEPLSHGPASARPCRGY